MTFDVIFISYNESNAQENWRHLNSLRPDAKRVHGVRGILNAHRKAAEICETDFLFVVDGDNYVLPEFNFALPEESLNTLSVYVWRSLNPVNGLVYGYGGVKLYPRELLREAPNLESTKADVATNVARNYRVINVLASETRFNASPLEAWRGAFRESAKLKMNIINGDLHAESRLKIWMEKGEKEKNGEWVLLGAKNGKEFAQQVIDGDKDEFSKLNDFQWLEEEFVRVRHIFKR